MAWECVCVSVLERAIDCVFSVDGERQKGKQREREREREDKKREMSKRDGRERGTEGDKEIEKT